MVPSKETEPTAIGGSDSKKRNNDMWGMHWFGPGMGWGWAVFGWAMMVPCNVIVYETEDASWCRRWTLG